MGWLSRVPLGIYSAPHVGTEYWAVRVNMCRMALYSNCIAHKMNSASKQSEYWAPLPHFSDDKAQHPLCTWPRPYVHSVLRTSLLKNWSKFLLFIFIFTQYSLCKLKATELHGELVSNQYPTKHFPPTTPAPMHFSTLMISFIMPRILFSLWHISNNGIMGWFIQLC